MIRAQGSTMYSNEITEETSEYFFLGCCMNEDELTAGRKKEQEPP